MKTILVIPLFLLVNLTLAQAVDTSSGSGIYLNGKDFTNGKLSYVLNCNSSSDNIKLHHFGGKDYVDVIQNGKKTRLKKDSIFGYRDCERKAYRFFKERDVEYKIEENKSVIIYSLVTHVPAANKTSFQSVTTYFFSKTSNSEVLPLTLHNLKHAFPGNIKMHDLLDSELEDEAIATYDKAHKMFKVNFIISQSLLNK